jgi:Acetamidase/Formamidase family
MPVFPTSEPLADRTRAAGMAVRRLGARARSPPPAAVVQRNRATHARHPTPHPARKVPLMPEVVFHVDQSKSMRDQDPPGHNRWHPDIPSVACMDTRLSGDGIPGLGGRRPEHQKRRRDRERRRDPLVGDLPATTRDPGETVPIHHPTATC